MAVLHIVYYDVWPWPMAHDPNKSGKELKTYQIIWRKVVNEQKTEIWGVPNLH